VEVSGPLNTLALGPLNTLAIGPFNTLAIGPLNTLAIGPLNTLAIYLYKRTKLQGQVQLRNHFDIISSYVNANCMEICSDGTDCMSDFHRGLQAFIRLKSGAV
jgi:hypothetical protein